MRSFDLTETARNELVEIIDYVEREHGPLRAEGVQFDLLEAFQLIAASPGVGRRKPDLTGAATRWWFVHRYAVLYIVDDERITVLRFIHGARDLDRELFEDA